LRLSKTHSSYTVSAFGFNTGYVEELYKQFLENPDSVSESWKEFFADYRPSESFVAAVEARPQTESRSPGVSSGRGDGATPDPVTPASAPDSAAEEAETKAIRGPAARIVENMEASLGVPTATSIRTVPVKLMTENRELINVFQRYSGGEKVSFTHMIAWALVQAIKAFPTMNTTFRHENGTPEHVIPKHINLGLAIDIERRGKRTLLVPNIKAAEEMSFAQFLGIYNDVIRRARNNELEVSDFAGTTATLTNPGMIGTTMSVARLMPGQGVILGAGSIGFPPEYHAFAPNVVSKTGISQVMTITSTYDHRVIQGAESGAFLQYMAGLLLGENDFYSRLFSDLGVPYPPYRLDLDTTPSLGREERDAELDLIRKQASVLQLIRAYRVRGHLQADVNPLGHDWRYHPELDPAAYDLTIWDLDRRFITGGLGGKEILPLREILSILRDTYTRKIGIEFMHISDPGERRWLQERIEPTRCEDPIAPEAKRRVLQKLNAAEAFERFLHTKFIGHKRFSLEGAESVIPMLDAMLTDAAEQEVEEVVIGMAHRGRLNVLTNILNKPYEVIFSEFEGSIDPNTTQGSGDVKYHLGARAEHEAPSGRKVKLMLASNPSHLEAVNPVVEGMVRARQEILRHRTDLETPSGDYLDAVIPILLHGDAAFAGQGVVAETLNLSQLRGYQTGGTIHVVINNQIGFTTAPSDARSSTYATDIARMIQAPIFHVNGDDPEACLRVARLALDYRQVYNKDVVIDLLCYRVHGHNEGDEPTYTQPILYRKIEAKRSPRKLYTEFLLRRGEMQPEEAEQLLDDYRDRLQEAFDRTRELEKQDGEPGFDLLAKRKKPTTKAADVDTRASMEDLTAVARSLSSLPEEFNVHKKLERQFQKREKLFTEEKRVDWGFAEALAFGTLLLDGTRVRLAGQDSRRGTFSHRHAVLYDQQTGEEYLPLNNIRDGQARLFVFDSLLSEYAACGFEYGYTVGDPSALVIWEAQFGDFANGAQIVYDQFLSAAEEKWGQTSSLVLLLPHGYEGQGPEHSSARLERFLQLCAEDNMIVANFTTPANLFHALRRQVKRTAKKPLIVMAPKSLLRHPEVVSAPEDLSEGQFMPIYPGVASEDAVERIVFCSGKVYFDLTKDLSDEEKERVAIVRVEQFYPFPHDEVAVELERYKKAEMVIWAQEEPANMGAWWYIRQRLDDVLEEIHGDCNRRVRYVGRHASASTATGSHKMHEHQQGAIVRRSLGRE
jgi:multifunctional 2-oxoglutarate metabolism enzyme